MVFKSPVPLRCIKCGGMKYIGEPYHAFGEWHVDVTCLVCAHSRDIEMKRLKSFLESLKGHSVKRKLVKHL
jgi:hypothetical protein